MCNLRVSFCSFEFSFVVITLACESEVIECLLKHVLVAKNIPLAIPKKRPLDLYGDIRLLGLDQGPTETGVALYDFKDDCASHLKVLRLKELTDTSIEGIGRIIDNLVEYHEVDAVVMGVPLPLAHQTTRNPCPDPNVSPARLASLVASMVPDPYFGLSASELASKAYSGVRRVYDFVNGLGRVQSNVLFTFHNEARTTEKANAEFLAKMNDLALVALTEKRYDLKELLKKFVLPVYHRHIEAAFGGYGSFEPEERWYNPAIWRSWANMEAAKIIVEDYRAKMEREAIQEYGNWSQHFCVNGHCYCFDEA
ncbi:hypothetical protein Q3G72_000811 [Acer saccharum]|nr:hypothetical protein Q3G72_000811 [Acer saccharum]